METDRKPYESLKQLSTAFSYPGRSDQMDYSGAFTGEGKGKHNVLYSKVYDPTAFRAFDIWGNGVVGNFMPKGTSWFKGQMEEKGLRDSKAVSVWLQDLDEHLRGVLSTSRDYYSAKLAFIKDAGCIGDGFMFIDKDKMDGKIIANVPHPRECFVKYDWWGRVMHLHHKFALSMEEVVNTPEFGLKSLSEAQQSAYKDGKNNNKKIQIIHGVYRNKDYNPDSISVKDMLWQHYYVNASAPDGGKMMQETGTYTLNPIPWSLNRPSHEGYGRGIVSQMLLEILTCNFISKDMQTASQQAVNPSTLITSALKHKLDRRPGANNYVTAKDMMGLKMGDLMARLIDTSGYPFGVDNHQRWQNMINDRFGVSLFLALSMNPQAKTLGEAHMVKAEQVVMQAPFLGTMGTTTDMELDRIYSLEAQFNPSCPKPPQEVLDAANGRVDIQYIGPFFQLLNQYYETGNLLTTIAHIREVLSVAPDSQIVIEGDELMRKILKSNNAPESIILSQNEVQELRALAARIQEQQMQMEIAKQSAAMVPNLSKKIESDSVLSQLAKQAA